MIQFFENHGNLIISVVIAAVVIIASLTVYNYIRLKKQEMYSYKNINFLGGSIFMVAMLIMSIIALFLKNEFITPSLLFINNMSATSHYFVLFSLPLCLLFFFFMGISNLSLLRHEGKNTKNIVGSILGFLFFAGAIAAIFGWDIVYQKIIIEIYGRGYRWVTIFDDGIQSFFLGVIRYLECFLMATIIYSIKSIRFKPEYNKDYVIILGCSIRKDGTPTPLLQGRIDRAIKFAKAQFEATKKKITFVPSGGQGSDECISEAESMKGYLLSQGIDEDDIIIENKSVNTLENMKFSKALIEADGKGENVLFSTTNYHVFRSGIYAGKAGLKAQGIGSKTKWYFWPNAFAREFVALMVSGLKGHLANIGIILILSFVRGYLTFVMVG